MEIIGKTLDDKTWDHLKGKWVLQGQSGVYKCPMHNTLFDPEEEPCWQCWDIAYKEI